MRALRMLVVSMLTGVLVPVVGAGVALAGGWTQPPSAGGYVALMAWLALALVVFIVIAVALARGPRADRSRSAPHTREKAAFPSAEDESPRVLEDSLRRG